MAWVSFLTIDGPGEISWIGDRLRKKLDTQPVESGFEGGWEASLGSRTMGVDRSSRLMERWLHGAKGTFWGLVPDAIGSSLHRT